jgi:hypothetical protein
MCWRTDPHSGGVEVVETLRDDALWEVVRLLGALPSKKLR